MTWAHPAFLPGLLVLPVAAILLRLAWRRYRATLGRLATDVALAGLVPPGVLRARGWQLVLAFVALALGGLAAAGPRLGFDYEQRQMQGVSIQVLLDVSNSMDAADVAPSRMERARREVEDLVGLLHGDAVGLVLFAAGAWTRIPLTTDYGTFLWAVKDSSPSTIRSQGSALSGALDAAVKALAKAPASGRAVIVVSDGELHEPAEVLDAAVQRAREANVRIYALGVGDTRGAPVPLAEGGFKKDEAGNVVLSKLDEAALSALASATGGAYVRAVSSDADVRALIEDEIHTKLEASQRGVRRDTVWRERFQWPLSIAFFAMVGVAAAGIGRRWAPLLLLFALPLDARADTRSDGMSALAEERWADAARLLGQARVEEPGDPGVTQGLATALYRQGRYREAEQMFDTLSRQIEDPGQRAISLYNAANAAYRGGRLDDALGRYQEALQLAPGLASAQKNFDAVSKEVAARRNPPPPQDGESGQEPQSGEPQDGQQGAPQDGQPGEAGEPGEPQPGEGSPGAPQDGQPPEGGQEPGGEMDEPGDPGEQPGEAPGEAGEVGEGEEIEGMPSGEGSGATAGSTEMTADQAGRLVDSVVDGKPRVVVGGASSGKDW